MGNPIAFSIIGTGFIGRVHAGCVSANPRARIATVYDVNRAAAENTAADFSAVAAGSIEEAVEMADAVIIGTPTSTHGEIARLCIERRTPFLCEKPLDTSLESALATARSAKEAGVFAGMGLNRRFDAHYRALRQAVGAGELGRIEMMLMTSRTQSPPPLDYVATSGGQLRDKGAHWFDLACWLSGERPAEIFVKGNCLIDPRYADHGDVDTAAITLEMRSGALCLMDFSRRTAYGYDERVEIAGSEGMMQARPPVPVNVALHKGSAVTGQGLHQTWYPRVQETYPAQLDAFVDALRVEGSFPTLEDGLVAETIAMAGGLSLREGRPVPIRYDFEL